MQHILKFIAGIWYSPSEELLYYFHLIEHEDRSAGLLKVKDDNSPPQRFQYRIVKEDDKLFLQIDDNKYRILKLIGTPKPIIKFHMNNETIELQKL